MRSKPLIIIPIVVVSAILILFASDSIYLDKLCYDDGGKRIGDTCYIPIITNSTKENSESLDISQIRTMKPDSMEFFYYPNNKNHDAYQLFMLIRLPEWMGGGANDVSAFRAYSVKSLDDPCLVKYWPGYDRQRIENPCQGGMYRVIDGALMNLGTPLSNKLTALPHLDLTIDENGFLYVEPPKFTKTDNGVIGYGKEITQEEFDKGTILENTMRQKFQDKINTFYFPETLSTGHKLQSLDYRGSGKIAFYLKDDRYEKMITISTAFCDCSKTYKQVLESDVKSHYGEFWRINNTDIYANPTIVDATKNTRTAYSFTFYKDGFKVVFSTPLPLEDGIKLVLENYFPEYRYEDIFLILKNN